MSNVKEMIEALREMAETTEPPVRFTISIDAKTLRRLDYFLAKLDQSKVSFYANLTAAVLSDLEEEFGLSDLRTADEEYMLIRFGDAKSVQQVRELAKLQMEKVTDE